MSDIPIDSLPLGFEAWPASRQLLTLMLLTFVTEDGTAVTAALMAQASLLNGWIAFWGTFLGIWLGDAGLYGLARGLGRPFLHRPWVARFLHAERIDRSERWFHRQGTWLLLSSRFLPGTRLPTYLAAGVLKLPFLLFIGVTGIAVLIWTVLIFALAHAMGLAVLKLIQDLPIGIWGVLLGILGLIIVVRLLGSLITQQGRRTWASRLGRWAQWEFWPPWLFYVPPTLYYLALAARHRSWLAPTAANPGMEGGGFVGESKFTIMELLRATAPAETVETHLMDATDAADRLRQFDEILQSTSLAYPLILKPDVGQKGYGVKRIESRDDAADYLTATRVRLLVQAYAPGPLEAGIFYYRRPDEPRGHLFAITDKQFPVLVADGTSSIRELIWRDRRARWIASIYLKRLNDRADDVPQAGESIQLVYAGNHAQGCLFKDGRHLTSDALLERIDAISRALPGFYFGRYDVRYADPEALRAGQGFKIIELNGAGAEATNIYDPDNTLVGAYRTLFRQWDLAFQIGRHNQSNGAQVWTVRQFLKAWHRTLRELKTLPPAD